MGLYSYLNDDNSFLNMMIFHSYLKLPGGNHAEMMISIASPYYLILIYSFCEPKWVGIDNSWKGLQPIKCGMTMDGIPDFYVLRRKDPA